MTKIEICQQNGNITKVECSDHAGFADYGKDIVCAGISSITQTAVLGIKKLTKIEHNFVVDEKKGFLSLEIFDSNVKSQDFHDAQVILKTMFCGLEDLAKQYPKYVKLEVK